MDRNSKFSAQNYDETIYGIDTIKEGHRVAFLYNVKTATITDEDLIERTALSLYMIEPNGNMIHAYLKFPPYFYVTCNEDLIKEMMVYLEKKFEKRMASVELVEKVDLDMTNYLSGKLKKYIKLNFRTINDLMFVRNIIRTKVEQTKKKVDDFSFNNLLDDKAKRPDDLMDSILEMREYDVPYHIRVCIDKNLRTAFWYSVSFKDNYVDEVELLPDKTGKPELHILAFDIETTKLPMKFPDAKFDQIMMISYVIDGKGYLITNRQIISADIQNFEYTPKPEFECRIKVYNEPNEAAVIDRFFAHIRKVKPLIIVSYNGDFFDWPFVEARAKVHNFDMHHLTGIQVNNEEYYGRYVTHMDCMCWVNRDSYLPQGSRGLKNVTKHKLGYNPIELDPEMMLPLAREDPQLLSQYSVSDAIATYYLYMKHIHDFIFALCTIIPTFPDEVLRSGSGTLCENLLMAEAFKRNIIFPNKKKEEFEKFFKGHLLNSETYIGGKVECINSGVYREDIPTRFRLEPEAYHHLMKETDKILEFIIETELGMNVNEITNFDEIKSSIVAKLHSLSEVPANYDCQPLIYHLDVAAMYPNIILTNRLQPTAIVNDKTCSGCLFNRPESNCKRNLNWEWKGEYFPLTRSEYEHVKVQIEYEHLKNSENEKSFYELPQDEQQLILKKRVKEMSQKVYKQVYQTKIELKENTVCMRSNSFYVDTIRDFRDRRYEFKNLVKVWKGKMQECESKDNTVGAQEAKEMSIMYESLQLAHKIILNSFYGYVMRRGARWYSMEMAAMVTHIGSNIISDAKGLIDRIGKPLELDTDGIWCLLPKGFPENFTFSNTQGKKFKFSFPCSMLNLLIHEKYLNPQYQTLIDPKTLKYDIKKEMSVFFEVDGPYKAMIIPAAREENKMLKKRYVVYNRDGSIAEVKGFELKRRGELKIIKIFQEDLFNHFLDGQTLEECYLACGATAERWLDILYKRGEGVNDEELLEYIGESKMLSRNIAEYDKQRGVALTAAKRMAEFLGSDILQGKGLNCFFIISQKPVGLPISERVIPAMIFNAEEATKRRFLNKWLKDGNISNTDMRSIIDWDYYIDRLGNSIQKVLTIPAALQKVKNPVPRVPYPDWLHKLVRDYDLKFEQKKINSFFHKPSSQPAIENQVMDVEDILPNPATSAKKSTIKSFLNLGKSQTSSARESIGKGFVISSQHQVSGSQFLASSSQDAGPSIPRDVFFDMNTEFDNWLKWQKGLWRARRKGDAGSKRKSDPKNSIGSMFRSQEEHVIASVWHVLQVCETETPGIYKLWIYLENSQIFSVKVKARRTFYVNSLVKTDLEAYKLVKKRLPRNKKAFYLYETVMDEENFVNEFHNFDEFLTNPDYEGVYENKVPLDFKIICDVGSVVRFNRNKSKHYNGHAMYTFDVDELKQIYDKPYLTDFNIPILVISQISMKGKMIWSVFNNNLGEFNFFIVERNHVPNNYKKIVKDILRENNEEAQDMVFKISVNSYEKDEIVMTHIEQYLQQLKDRNRNTPYIIVLQTQYKLPRLNQLGLKSIMNSYPTLHLPVVDSSEISFSSLDWQLKGIRHLTYQYLNMNEYLDELLGFCRYSNIPFCNIGHDRLNFVTDVVYARILKKANCISWYSMTGVPETGGGKMDDARELIPTDFIPSEVINPNLYTDFCVEIDIELLARNAICASDELKSLESENSTAVDFSTLEEPKVNAEGPRAGDERRAGDDLDETVVSRAAFHLVKVMADIWSLDVVNHSNEYADRLLGNLQRWVCDEESRFYDVMLHKMLNILMKKVYGYLLQRLKNLGAKIVYASPSKIIIGTGKYVFHEAENYSQFILRTVISYPIFSDLNLSPKKYWKILLLKDRFNYGGITEDEEKKIDFTWNVSEYLPPQLSRQLLVTLADYINKVSKFIERILEDDITEPGARLQEFHEKVANLSKRHVTEILSYHMFEAIPRLNEYFKEYQIRAAELKEQQLQNAKRKERLNGEEEEEVLSQRSNEDSFEEEYDQDKNAEIKEWEFPQVLGRIPEYKNGVLELIKFLSHILAYDENVQDETVIMKRNCLKLLGMSDFAEEAKYIEPCKKFVLTDIVCKGCSNVIEVDVFRDKIFKDKDFNCQVCGTKFDERRLETKIIKLLKQYIIFYQIQDLYCSKCKMAKSELLDNLCKCSGKYVMREDTPAHGFKTEQKQLIRSFEELATHCDFPLLRDYLLELRFESSLSI